MLLQELKEECSLKESVIFIEVTEKEAGRKGRELEEGEKGMCRKARRKEEFPGLVMLVGISNQTNHFDWTTFDK